MRCSVKYVFTLALGIASCSRDLPKAELPPDSETEMREDSQQASGAGGDMPSTSENSMRAASAGASVGSAGRGGSQGSGNAMRAAGSGGDTSEMQAAGGSGGSSMTNNGKGGSGSSMMMMSGGGSSSPMPAGKVVAACMGRAGETVCDGASLIKCGDGGTMMGMERCMTAAQCNAGLEAGTCGKCDPGAVQCMGAELRECSMTGEFMMKEKCASEQLCDEMKKMCLPPACHADEHKCDSGALIKCKDDLSDFETVVASCPVELCDAAAKKCNMCVPGKKECMGATLRTCATDGSGYTDTKCAEPTDQCVDGRCVECSSNSECMTMSTCQEGSCNMETGRCNMPTSKPLGTNCSDSGGKVCNLIGQCVQCNTDLECASDERCSAVLGCIERAALTAVSLLPGRYTVQLNAGWKVRIDSGVSREMVRVTAPTGTYTADSAPNPLASGSKDSTTILTFNGPTGQEMGLLGFATSCLPVVLDESATLYFALPTKDDMGNPTGHCTDVSVHLVAERN